MRNTNNLSRTTAASILAIIALAAVPRASATWSVVLVDTATGEIGVAAATCETGYDLSRLVPVIRLGHGAAVAQSGGDWDGHRRQIIWSGLEAGASPAEILERLAEKTPTHELHQYGIVDVHGRTLCFTGIGVGYAAHASGQLGSLAYAIQGNGVAGSAVIDAAELALQTTDGGLPGKLIAAMEAAARVGGDGRCSCGPKSLQACTSPVPYKFTKAAHIAFAFVARPGDDDLPCPPPYFCGNPSYYMMLNIADAAEDDPPPIAELRRMFDTFRARTTDLPDAIETTATIDDTSLVADGVSETTVRIVVRDWRGEPVGGVSRIRLRGEIAGQDAELELLSIETTGKGEFVARVRTGARPGQVALVIDVDHPDHRPIRIARAPQLALKGSSASPADPTGENDHDSPQPKDDPLSPNTADADDGGGTASDIEGPAASPGASALCPLIAGLALLAALVGFVARKP